MASYRTVILREKTMTRKLLTAMFFVLLTFSIAPVQAYAAVNTTQDEALLIQKKKKLAALKAAEDKKKAARAAEVTKLKAARQKRQCSGRRSGKPQPEQPPGAIAAVSCNACLASPGAPVPLAAGATGPCASRWLGLKPGMPPAP